MEGRMLNISLKDHKRDAWIHQKTGVTDIAKRVPKLEIEICRPDCSFKRINGGTGNWLGKRERERPLMRSGRDIKRHVGFAWIKITQNRGIWKEMGDEAYVQKYIENN